jgi:hypothetical protein
MSNYISDKDRLSESMGQFQLWYGKLFYYHSNFIGWRYLKDV